jgi:hypothetical protein
MTILEQRFMESLPCYVNTIAKSLEVKNKIAALTLAKNAALISNEDLSKELKPIFKELNLNLN